MLVSIRLSNIRVNMFTFLCVFVFINACAFAHGLPVHTTEGVVEGYKATDGDYYEFYGIPYAGPTDGIHRFKAPVPPAPHPEVLHANVTNIRCAQPSRSGIVGVENCLTLDIFTNNFTTPRPVIVWLNAEDYTTTSTQVFSFRTFVDQDLVFVSVNFRLSIFGFLCLGIQEAPGNAGLRDVIQALKWINYNIENFGGDQYNVVLMGHGSGAAIVDLLTMAPQAKGLVHKAVALSGSGLAPWAVAYDPVGYAEALGAKLGYTGESTQDLAKHLITMDISFLNSALAEFSHFKNNTLLFAPCIENVNLNPNDTILADVPLNLLRSGNYLQIPYITGYTSREGTMRAKEILYGNWINAMNKNLTMFFPVDLAVGDKDIDYATFQIADTYFHDFRVTMKHVDQVLKYEGDVLVVAPVVRGAKERSVKSKAEVRLFEFDYMGTYNSRWVYKQIPLKGARHGIILNYLFDFDLMPSDKSVMQSIVKRLATFAYTGSQISTSDTLDWAPFTKEGRSLFYFGPNTDNIFTEEFLQSMAIMMWEDLYTLFYKFPNPVNYRQLNSTGGDSNSVGSNKNCIGMKYVSAVFVVLSQLLLR